MLIIMCLTKQTRHVNRSIWVWWRTWVVCRPYMWVLGTRYRHYTEKKELGKDRWYSQTGQVETGCSTWDRWDWDRWVSIMGETGWDWDRGVFRLGGAGWDWDRCVFN